MTTSSFGTYLLPLWARILVRICQSIPVNDVTKRLLFVLRKPVLFLTKSPIDSEVKGAKFRLYPVQNLSDKRLLCTPGQLDGIERKFFEGCSGDVNWLVDLGANIGGYSLLLAAEMKKMKVVAVEADPELEAHLRANIEFSGFGDRITPMNVAVSDRVGTLTLNRDPVNRGKNTVSTSDDSQDNPFETVAVDAIPLLEVLNRNQIEKPGIVKLDIEGYEFVVLKSFFAEAPKNRWPKYIQLEQHRKEPYNEAVELTMEQGYRLILRTRMNIILELV